MLLPLHEGQWNPLSRFGGSSLEITSPGLNHTKLLLTNAERHFSRIFSARGNTFNSIEFQDFVKNGASHQVSNHVFDNSGELDLIMAGAAAVSLL
jgi:hypothetical protein